MTTAAPATLVWLAPDPPNLAQAEALSSFARARGLLLVRPGIVSRPRIPVDDSAPSEIEDLLAQARESIVSGDAVATDRAISSAEVQLKSQALLPQAAWLMAEVERTRAARWRRIEPIDTQAANRAWMRAEALDGGRVPGLGEEAGAVHSGPATIDLAVPAGDDAWLDGVPTPRAAVTRSGPHVLSVTSGGAPVWATWFYAPEGRSTVSADTPWPAPCSSGDMRGAALRELASGSSAVTVLDAASVRCGAWVAATAVTPRGGAVRVALCVADRCGALIDWPPSSALLQLGPSGPHRLGEQSVTSGTSRPWPAWASWATVGAGAAVLAGIVVFASGALQSTAGRSSFVSGGLKTQ
ncbi:MAG: hypothetical protein ACREJ3_05535 [Polyangiaceae bacterium]